MKCQYFVATPRYSKPGQCANLVAKVIRWAPSPLTTKVLKLCPAHRKMLESGRLKIVDGKLAL